MNRALKKICLVNVDVEEDYADTGGKTFLGVENLDRILKVFDKFGVRATLFVTGEVLEHYPDLVRKWSEKHEISCHGYYHRRLSELPIPEREKQMIDFLHLHQETLGTKPLGFRARENATDNEQIRLLEKFNFTYDGSVISRRPFFLRYIGYQGRSPSEPYHPSYENYREIGDARIIEIPLNPLIMGIPLQGTWLRIFGAGLYQALLRLKKPRFITLSMHSWDCIKYQGKYSRNSGDNFLKLLERLLESLDQHYVFSSYSEFIGKAGATGFVARRKGKLGEVKLGVITPRIFHSGQPILSSFIRIFEALYDEIFVITRGFEPEAPGFGKNVQIKNVNYLTAQPKGDNIIEYIVVPVSLCLNLLRMRGGTKTVVFLLGNISLVLPVLTAKLMGKRVALVLTGLYSKNAEAFYKDNLMGRLSLWVLEQLEAINLAISDLIIGYTGNTVHEFNLQRYKAKISGGGARFVDMTLFKVTNNLSERRNLIGYIGRFRGEKGTLNFIAAIPLVRKEYPEIEFSMIGDGTLFPEVERKVRDVGGATLSRWLPHNEVPKRLNQLKLLVIPSYSETGPYIAIEAMACGTPVLATPVGFIPDIIKDGDTGFILPDNSPESIARNIIRVLSHPDLSQVSGKAQSLVGARYSFQGAVNRYRAMLQGKNGDTSG